jgi:hypothetical protein
MQAHAAPPPPLRSSSSSTPFFATLPREVTAAVFALLPADTRLLCRGVCRSWRATLSEARFWAALDLSAAARLARGDATSALLRAAAARAAGRLATLDISGCGRIRHEALLRVVGANASMLRDVFMVCGDDHRAAAATVPQLEALLQAGPQLRALHVDAACASVAEALPLLTGAAPPWQRGGPLRVRSLSVAVTDADAGASIRALADALPAHAPLEELRLLRAPLDQPGALGAVVDACVECHSLRSLRLDATRLGADAAPQLARLLRAGTRLRNLHLEVDALRPVKPLLDDAGAALIADALRANATLTSLRLVGVALFPTPDAAATLLGALVGHPSLQLLVLWGAHANAATALSAGGAVAALLAANAPALEALVVSRCGLGEAGLRPLLAALPANTHLRSLELEHEAFSEAFARSDLLPAVRANASLQRLLVQDAVGAARDAMALVDSRVAGGMLHAAQSEPVGGVAAMMEAANGAADAILHFDAPPLLGSHACEEASDEVWDALALINSNASA